MSQSTAQLEVLIRRNADACANARKKRCKCLCGGTLHRKPHTENWIKETVAKLGEVNGQ